jgi:hypothetical protein
MMKVDELYMIYNPKGMAAKSSYAIWTDSEEYVTLDMMGAESAVKAIWSAVVHNGGKGILSYRENGINKRLRKMEIEGVNYIVKKESLLHHPIYHRWHLIPELSKDSSVRYLWTFDKDWDVLIDQFYLAMQMSIYPIQKDWVRPLFDCGFDNEIITKLQHTINIGFAYEIQMNAWEEIINDMLLGRLIHVDGEMEAA